MISLLASSKSFHCGSDLSGEPALTHLYRLGADTLRRGDIGHGITPLDDLPDRLLLELRYTSLRVHDQPPTLKGQVGFV